MSEKPVIKSNFLRPDRIGKPLAEQDDSASSGGAAVIELPSQATRNEPELRAETNGGRRGSGVGVLAKDESPPSGPGKRPPSVVPVDDGERLLSAGEVARRLGVSERFIRDHTTRRSPRIRGMKLGPLLRFRWSDVETFLAALDTTRPSRGRRFGV